MEKGGDCIRVLARYVLLVLMLMMLVASVTAAAFNIQEAHYWQDASSTLLPAYMVETDAQNEQLRDEGQVYRPDSQQEGLETEDWRPEGWRRFIVGVNASELEVRSVEETVCNEGGNVTGRISLGERVQALTVEVPVDNAFLFGVELRKNELVQYVSPDSIMNASFVPNDPCWANQWGPKKIQADQAWDAITGSSEILVAVLDTGIYYPHPDLAANYVPLGYDWVNDDADPMDDNGHGTHCAGIIAARINNSLGIAGLAQVRIMTEKVLNSAGWGYNSWTVQGIYHAVSKGARIISMSLGGSSDDPPIHEAVQYANSKGVLVVAAAGNTGTDSPHYPAAYEEVVAVSATDANDGLAWFSTFGNWIDLSAPGVDIFSTVTGNSYAYKSGTSMACPHVTGVAALALSAFPNYTVSQLRRDLLVSADDLGESGFDRYFGYGRINARKAIKGLPEHDVGIELREYPGRLDPSQNGTFSVTVVNLGISNETDMTVRILVNGSLLDTATIDFLQGGGSSSPISFLWSSTVIGCYNFTCYVDPVPMEDNAENNEACSMVAVRFPAVLRIPSDYPTIKSAIESAGKDDTIVVSEGLYAEGQIAIRKNGITLVADGTVTLSGRLGGHVFNVAADFVRIEGFNIRECSAYAVSVGGRGNVIARNTIVASSGGLYLHDGVCCIIDQNLVCCTVSVEKSTMCTISRNRFVSGWFALWQSSNNTVTENILEGGTYQAFALSNSQGNLITFNNISGNMIGLVLGGTSGNVFRNNTMSNNICNLSPWLIPGEDYWRGGANDIDASNTVDGKPVCYWVNVSNRVVPSGVGFVGLVGCENITVENLELKGNFNGIFIYRSNNVTIRNNNIVRNAPNYEIMSGGIFALGPSNNITVISNNIHANERGIFLWEGNGHVIEGNNITNTIIHEAIRAEGDTVIKHNRISGSRYCGISTYGSNCVVESNVLTANVVGIKVVGSKHTITSNTIIGDKTGIFAEWATDCTICANNIIKCGSCAFANDGSGNRVFHNNFINNTRAFKSSHPEYSNAWDDGYPSGGNYWTDYNGTDSNGDGIGDTPYGLDPNDTDRYPLMRPFAGYSPPDTYTLTIAGFIDSDPTGEFYDSPIPPPGKYVFAADSIVRIDTLLPLSAYLDRWLLDGVWVGSLDHIEVLLEKNHTLTAAFSHMRPFNRSLSPSMATTKTFNPVAIKSLETGVVPRRTYVWYVNDTPVLEAASRTFKFTPTKPGTYSVRVNIRCRSSYEWALYEYSLNATIVVGPSPAVSILPVSASIYMGQSIELTSNVSTGSPPYEYRWYVNGSAVPGAISDNWTFAPGSRGTFRIYFDATDDNGTVIQSDEALLAVEPWPTATVFPISSLAYVAKPVTLTATRSGGHGPSTCQWYVDNSPVMYATSDVLNFIPSTSGEHTIYLVVADRQDTSATSNEAAVYAVAQPVISIVPNSTRILICESVCFASTASGGYPPYSYQWSLNDSVASEANSSSWIFTPTSAGNYSVYASVIDRYGTTSESKRASVITAPQLIISVRPSLEKIFLGEPIAFWIDVSGGYPPYGLQWFLDGTFVLGATSDSFLFGQNATGTYCISAEVTDSLGNVRQSNTVSVRAVSRPVGGESLSIRHEPELEQIPPYLVLTAGLACLASKTRRKKQSLKSRT